MIIVPFVCITPNLNFKSTAFFTIAKTLNQLLRKRTKLIHQILEDQSGKCESASSP
uniref:Uncharacterized protein n=1 Tax=Arundo donax TaxID=35708 RepID=A0A0A9DNU2_ARUDO